MSARCLADDVGALFFVSREQPPRFQTPFRIQELWLDPPKPYLHKRKVIPEQDIWNKNRPNLEKHHHPHHHAKDPSEISPTPWVPKSCRSFSIRGFEGHTGTTSRMRFGCSAVRKSSPRHPGLHRCPEEVWRGAPQNTSQTQHPRRYLDVWAVTAYISYVHSLGFASALMLGKKFNKQISLKWWFSSHGTIGQKIRWKTCSSKFCGIKKKHHHDFPEIRPLLKLGLSLASLKYCHFRERSIFPRYIHQNKLDIVERSFSDRQTHHHKFISSDFGTAGIQGCCIIQGLSYNDPFRTGTGLPRMILSLFFQSFPKVRIGGNGVLGVSPFPPPSRGRCSLTSPNPWLDNFGRLLFFIAKG